MTPIQLCKQEWWKAFSLHLYDMMGKKNCTSLLQLLLILSGNPFCLILFKFSSSVLRRVIFLVQTYPVFFWSGGGGFSGHGGRFCCGWGADRTLAVCLVFGCVCVCLCVQHRLRLQLHNGGLNLLLRLWFRLWTHWCHFLLITGNRRLWAGRDKNQSSTECTIQQCTWIVDANDLQCVFNYSGTK